MWWEKQPGRRGVEIAQAMRAVCCGAALFPSANARRRRGQLALALASVCGSWSSGRASRGAERERLRAERLGNPFLLYPAACRWQGEGFPHR